MAENTLPSVPDYMKQFMNKQSDDANSAASASMSIPRISLKGKKFRFIENGEEVEAINDSANIIIMGIEPGPGRSIKTYYEKAYAGAASSGEPPTCSSDDGIRPSPWIQNPQHTNCAECPKNMFGSATSVNGRPAKACKDSKRLWVARPEDPQGLLYALNVTVSSLKNLAKYGEDRKESGVPLALTITKVIMLDDSDFPKLDFEVAGYIEADKAEETMARAEKREWSRPIPAGPAIAAPKAPTVSLPSPGQNGVPSTPANVDKAIDNWQE